MLLHFYFIGFFLAFFALHHFPLVGGIVMGKNGIADKDRFHISSKLGFWLVVLAAYFLIIVVSFFLDTVAEILCEVYQLIYIITGHVWTVRENA